MFENPFWDMSSETPNVLLDCESRFGLSQRNATQFLVTDWNTAFLCVLLTLSVLSQLPVATAVPSGDTSRQLIRLSWA